MPQSLITLIDPGLYGPLSLCRNSDLPFVDTGIVMDQLYQLNVHKSMGPDGIHTDNLQYDLHAIS